MRALIAIVALLWCAPSLAQGNRPPMLLDFTASWCLPCREMQPVMDKLARDGHDVREIDCSHGVPARFASYRVTSFPTFIVLDGSRREIGRQRGSCPVGVLLKLLGKAVRR
jgi:thioredoxin 1